MHVSIIIPVLNEASTLTYYLEDLQVLREVGHEVIVVDGGSDDETADKAKDLADVVRIFEPSRARQMNAGAMLADKEVLLFLHADTALPDKAVDLIISAMNNSEKCWGRFDVRLSGSQFLLRLVESTMNLRSRLTGIVTGDQAMFVRRDVFQQLGGYADMPLMEDIELSRRLKAQSRPVCLHWPVVTSSRRWEEKGIIRTILLMWSLRLAYFLGVSPTRLADLYYSSRGKG